MGVAASGWLIQLKVKAVGYSWHKRLNKFDYKECYSVCIGNDHSRDLERVLQSVYCFRTLSSLSYCPETLNPLNPELNPICYILALLGAHHFLHVSRIRVKLLTFRLLMPYIYGAPILDVSRSHTTTQRSR